MSAYPAGRGSPAAQMEFSLLVRRVEQLEARAEDIDNLRHRLSICQSQLAYFQCEAERLQRLCDSLEAADRRTLHRLQRVPPWDLRASRF